RRGAPAPPEQPSLPTRFGSSSRRCRENRSAGGFGRVPAPFQWRCFRAPLRKRIVLNYCARRPISGKTRLIHFGVQPMLRKTLFALTMAVLFSLAGGNAFAAEPTLHQVYQAAETGDYRAAQAMMDQVLRDHPNSAKAHFVEAELLAKQGRLAEARGELETAQRLAPGLPFAKPEAVRELHARLSSPQGWGQSGAHNPLASVGSWSPWGMLLLIVGLAGAGRHGSELWRGR